MSTKLMSVVLECHSALVRPLGGAPAALLGALSAVFRPRTIWVSADENRDLQLDGLGDGHVGAVCLWHGEAVEPGRPLTRVSPADAGLVDQLASAGLVAERSIYMSATGALRFRAPGDAVPAWYGRWHRPRPLSLLDLVTVRMEWTAETRQVEVSLGLSGFPLTTSDLLPDGSLGDGDIHSAAANRQDVFDALAHVPEAIGLSAAGGRWIDDGDYGYLFPNDAEDVRSRWLPWLNDRIR